MLGALEDLAAIGPLAFEHGARIVQPVGADVERRVTPGNELAVIPDDAIKPVIGFVGHAFLRADQLVGGCPPRTSVVARRSRLSLLRPGPTRGMVLGPHCERDGRTPL